MDDAFYTRFKVAVDYKWKRIKHYIYFQVFLYFVYVGLIWLEVLANVNYTVDSPYYTAPGILHALIVFSVFWLLFEFIQIYQMRLDYLKEVSNYTDMFGCILILTYCSLKLQNFRGSE